MIFTKIKAWLDDPGTIYFMCKMTGLMQDDMRKKADIDVKVLQQYGLVVHHPIIKENIPMVHEPLKDRTEKEMVKLWNDDKRAIKNAAIVIDSAAEQYSTGAKREFGKARYRDWTPTVTLWEKSPKPPFIAREEDDVCAHSIDEAGQLIHKLWGTRIKRMAWKLPIYLSNLHDLSIYKITRFFK